MSLKSLVNKSVIKSDLRRYWWLGAIFAGWLFLTTAIPANMVMNSDYFRAMSETEQHFIGSHFADATMASPFTIIAFCIIIPAMLYSYLHHKSAVSAAHSLPLKRECLYFSHLFSAGVLIAAAIVINAGIMLTMVDTSAWFILIWMCLSLVYAFVAMTFSAAASMLVGNVAAGVVLPFIVMLLPLFFTAMLQELCTNYLYGYAAYDVFRWLQWVYMDYESLLHGGAFWYIALGIVFIILGLVFYKKRALENHSRILAFDILNPIFMYGLAMCAGLAGYAYISTILYMSNGENFSMWIGLPFGIAGIIIARMIIAKTFKPKGIIKPVIIYVAMMFVVYLFFGFDITGFEKRVPDIDKIENVNVVNLYDVVREAYYPTGSDSGAYYVADSAIHDSNIYNSDDIEKVLALHNALIESGESDKNHYYIPIVYTLSNGRTMKRQYHIDRNNAELLALYGEVQDLEPVKGDRFPIISNAEIDYTGSNVENWGIDTWLTPERQEELLEALKKDVEALKFADYEFGNTLTSFHLNFRKPSVDENNVPVADKEKWYSSSIAYNIYPGYENSIALLESWGLYNNKPSVDNVVQVDMWGIGDNYNARDNYVNITDKQEIQKILDHLEANAEHMSDAKYMSEDTQIFEISYEGGEYFSVNAPKMVE